LRINADLARLAIEDDFHLPRVPAVCRSRCAHLQSYRPKNRPTKRS
jgi:hypothetical protein